MTSESKFQAYFLSLVPHGYRTALVTGSGFPDCLVVNRSITNYVELKILEIGRSGDKSIRTVFKPTQAPWYADYLSKGGDRLFIVFRLNKGYGLLHVDKTFVDELSTLKYSEMKRYRNYMERKTLKEIIYAISWSW